MRMVVKLNSFPARGADSFREGWWGRRAVSAREARQRRTAGIRLKHETRLVAKFAVNFLVSVMNTNGICPACQGQLSIWVAIRSPSPFSLRCPHCKKKLRVRMRGLWPFVIVVVLMFIALAAACIAAFGLFGWLGFFFGIAGLLLFWIIAEFATSILYFNYAKFTFEDRHDNGLIPK